MQVGTWPSLIESYELKTYIGKMNQEQSILENLESVVNSGRDAQDDLDFLAFAYRALVENNAQG